MHPGTDARLRRSRAGRRADPADPRRGPGARPHRARRTSARSECARPVPSPRGEPGRRPAPAIAAASRAGPPAGTRMPASSSDDLGDPADVGGDDGHARRQSAWISAVGRASAWLGCTTRSAASSRRGRRRGSRAAGPATRSRVGRHRALERRPLGAVADQQHLQRRSPRAAAAPPPAGPRGPCRAASGRRWPPGHRARRRRGQRSSLRAYRRGAPRVQHAVVNGDHTRGVDGEGREVPVPLRVGDRERAGRGTRAHPPTEPPLDRGRRRDHAPR